MAENNPVEMVVRGFTELDNAQQQEAVERINEYINSDRVQKRGLQENLQKRVSLGPLETGCPCCGR